ncbi:single-stranded-DNA-specific exonuclease RecJ [Magnetospira sp. QH-2]|uniref:single-stranded-DNA-specific exonuclease RecJ n=1 Tax=Magnetospira sp. (strain QH-2) TaxID=1288970 RepID=UPI00208E1434|nr:single-stranded-DNA-specific exonuclease RecJ [Magnetospira sp. QH-2]
MRGKAWRQRPGDDRLAMTLAQRFHIPELAGRVLAARGVDLETASSYLNPTLRDLMPDPDGFKDMATGTTRLADALANGETIALFGDYDVDGATSAALLGRFLRAVGGSPLLYVPDRLSEGYGPNGPALRRLREQGTTVAVTVDCGSTAFEALDVAAEVGLDVVVIDHHAVEPKLPKAHAFINPNRLDEPPGQGHLAAVGVTFLFAVALNRRLRERDWYHDQRPEPDLMGLLDLVALGTVCDVVPLVGLNRAYVTQGLKVMAKRRNGGLTALADVAGVNEAPGTYHAGFLLGPRVNAGGRVGQSDLGATLLGSDDPSVTREIAQRLDALNKERRDIEAMVLEQALSQVEGEPEEHLFPSLVMAVGEGWHPGVVGIVASRLCERFNRPACVLAVEGEKATGSGRSLPGMDLGAAVIAARQSEILLKGGGHAMAAGFTVDARRVDEFARFIAERLDRGMGDGGPVPELNCDTVLSVGAAHGGTIAAIERAAPFGAGNSEPRFVLADVLITHAKIVGENHVRCTLSGAAEGGRVNAMAFRSVDSELGQALLRHQGAAFHLAGHLRRDTWRGGNAVQFLIDDGVRVAETRPR